MLPFKLQRYKYLARLFFLAEPHALTRFGGINMGCTIKNRAQKWPRHQLPPRRLLAIARTHATRYELLPVSVQRT